MRIPFFFLIVDPPYPPHFWVDGGAFSKVVLGFRNPDITYDGLGEMFEGDSADKCKSKLNISEILYLVVLQFYQLFS